MKLSTVGHVGFKRALGLSSVAVTLLVAGAVCAQEQAAKTPHEQYKAAMDAARSGQLKAFPLVPIGPAEKTVRLATWTSEMEVIRSPEAADPSRQRTHRDFWVVRESEMAQRCKSLYERGKDRAPERIRQMLGLPPGFGGNGEGYITIMEVATDDRERFFRPCMQPDITTNSCAAPAPEMKCSQSDAGHQAWMCQASRANFTDGQFPWTRLGYTYDWGSSDLYGMSEYIVRGGTGVRSLGVSPLSEFCRTKF